MYTLDAVNGLKDKFTNDFQDLGGYAGQAKGFLEAGDLTSAREAIKCLFNQAVDVLPEWGTPVPRLRQDFIQYDDGLLTDTVQISSKDKGLAGVKFSEAISEKTDESALLFFVLDSFLGFIDYAVRNENLAEINAIVKEINKAAGNKFEIEFVDSELPVTYISDDRLELGINEAILYSYKDYILFGDENVPEEDRVLEDYEVEFNERIKSAREEAADMFKANSVIDFLQNRNDLVKMLTNVGTKKLKSILRGSVRKNPVWLGLTDKDVEVRYDLNDVFSIVKRENGVLEVSLNPVDLNTGAPVEDLDVLEEVRLLSNK